MWQTSFQDKLRIRFANHHSKCGQCLKHRLIIKKLGHCPAAQRLQSTMLQSHLRRQHADREIYWSARARSRIDSVQPQVFHLCGIIDSMDQQKHSWPRSRTLLAKDFVTLNRPRLSSTTFLCHGHGLYLHLSPHTVQCNGSRTCQIIMHGLSRIARSVDLRCTMVHLQGDNCSKELKNVTVLRAMSLLISERKLHGCECGFSAPATRTKTWTLFSTESERASKRTQSWHRRSNSNGVFRISWGILRAGLWRRTNKSTCLLSIGTGCLHATFIQFHPRSNPQPFFSHGFL